MSELRISCPFTPCRARPLVLEMRRADTSGNVIAQHMTDPGSWFGLCPASLMPWPIGPQAGELLAQQVAAYNRMSESRRRARGDAAPLRDPAGRVGEHSLTPKPAPSPGAFQNSVSPAERLRRRHNGGKPDAEK